ncbi:hypothetical protein ACY3XD_002646 [Vibrio cholerae]
MFMIVVCIGVIKVTITMGLNASLDTYIGMLRELSIFEVAIWFLIAFTGIRTLEDSAWFNGTYVSSNSTRIVEKEDGTTEELVTSSWGQAPDYEIAKSAFRWSRVSFVASVFALLVYYV